MHDHVNKRTVHGRPCSELWRWLSDTTADMRMCRSDLSLHSVHMAPAYLHAATGLADMHQRTPIRIHRLVDGMLAAAVTVVKS